MPAGETLSAGDTAQVTVRAAGTSGAVLDGGEVTVRFWPPGAWSGSLAGPSPRGAAAVTVTAAWDPALRAWAAYAATDGWAPGRHLALAAFAGPSPAGPARGSAATEVVIRA